MPNQEIKFDTTADEFGRPPQRDSGVDLAGKIIGWGLAKNRQQAQYVLVGVTIAALIVAYFIYHSFSGGSSVPTAPVYGTTQ